MYPELSSLGLTPEQLAVIERVIAAERDAVVERYRKANRDRVQKFRAKQTKTSHTVTQVKRNVTQPMTGNVTNDPGHNGNVTQNPGNITTQNGNVTTAKSLKVSRNFGNVTARNVTAGKGEGETYKEGGEGRVPLQVSSLSGNKPSEVSAVAEIPQVPDLKIAPTKPVPITTSQAQDPKTQVYALAKAKFGERGGGLVGRWAKQFPDYAQLLGFLTAATAKFPNETQPVIGYVVECIKARRDDAESRAKARKMLAEWQPERGRLLPKRDYSDPQNRFFLMIDGKKRYMNTEEVYRKYDDYCYEHDIVEG